MTSPSSSGTRVCRLAASSRIRVRANLPRERGPRRIDRGAATAACVDVHAQRLTPSTTRVTPRPRQAKVHSLSRVNTTSIHGLTLTSPGAARVTPTDGTGARRPTVGCQSRHRDPRYSPVSPNHYDAPTHDASPFTADYQRTSVDERSPRRQNARSVTTPSAAHLPASTSGVVQCRNATDTTLTSRRRWSRATGRAGAALTVTLSAMRSSMIRATTTPCRQVPARARVPHVTATPTSRLYTMSARPEVSRRRRAARTPTPTIRRRVTASRTHVRPRSIQTVRVGKARVDVTRTRTWAITGMTQRGTLLRSAGVTSTWVRAQTTRIMARAGAHTSIALCATTPILGLNMRARVPCATPDNPVGSLTGMERIVSAG
jgi:hypothetical protein